ncbi:hypothetical protein FAEPRAA2165_01518 [Faecalibacterium duncaniae]|uniref:Uncharacterized protein n=1 Tax=Faecalibacterium duncaniae (strain DSM 17677 / JCM 31915 / A2-165) TaxID=411483 RepID=C7H5E6_FAED2|nr:hypothetical protein FAEPRAA2165_01518 [Faecalibacterium duncaniae]
MAVPPLCASLLLLISSICKEHEKDDGIKQPARTPAKVRLFSDFCKKFQKSA